MSDVLQWIGWAYIGAFVVVVLAIVWTWFAAPSSRDDARDRSRRELDDAIERKLRGRGGR
jgi:protein-S-isoprenylcysteine O-methyltransferase Ste14